MLWSRATVHRCEVLLASTRKKIRRKWVYTLITRHPAPAATTPAVVLTLNKLYPSPPVPTISTTKSFSASSTAACSACALNTCAAASNDSGLLSIRLICSAVKNAPICDGCSASGLNRCLNACLRSAGVKYSGVVTTLLNKGLKESALRLLRSGGEYMFGSALGPAGAGIYKYRVSSSAAG